MIRELLAPEDAPGTVARRDVQLRLIGEYLLVPDFRRGAVFPILITGVSLNLQEALKEYQSQFRLPIKFIDEELFAKVLKYNSFL